MAFGSGSAGGLTEVQIGSAVEGEDEGGLACYRYLMVCLCVQCYRLWSRFFQVLSFGSRCWESWRELRTLLIIATYSLRSYDNDENSVYD